MPEFYSPKNITQSAEYPDLDISWSNNQVDTTIINNPDYNFADPDNGAGDKNIIQTVKNLEHIPNPTRGPRLNKTYYLKCTQFGAATADITGSITGITLLVDARRHGRIVDETICLTLNGEVISENKTNLFNIYGEGHLTNNDLQIYGGTNDTWGVELTPEMVTNPNFGVLIRFSSNPIYPHRDTIEINRILLTIHPFEVFVLDPNIEVIFVDEETEAYFIPE